MSESKRDPGSELLVLMQAVDNAGLHNAVAKRTAEKLSVMTEDDVGESDETEILLGALVSSIKELGYTDRVAAQVFFSGVFGETIPEEASPDSGDSAFY